MSTSYCLHCKKQTANRGERMTTTKSGRSQVMSQCAQCGKKKARFVKKGGGIFGSLGDALGNIGGAFGSLGHGIDRGFGAVGI